MRKLLFFLLLPASAFAQSSGAQDMSRALFWFDDILRRLVTTKSGFFLSVGWHEWVLFSGFAATMFLIRTAVANRRCALFDLEGAILLLGKMLFSSIFLSTYTVLEQIPQAFTHGLVELVGAGMMDPLLQRIFGILDGLEKPSLLNMVQVVTYFVTVACMAGVAMILFLLNAGTYLAIGMLTMFGPLVIPFLVTQHFSRWFYRWVDMVAAYSMLPVSIVIFTFVWAEFFMKLFDLGIMNDISLANFLTLLAMLAAMILAFIIMAFKLTSFNAELFSGAGSMGSSLAAGMENQLRGLARLAKG